jgi:hypothetical protein
LPSNFDASTPASQFSFINLRHDALQPDCHELRNAMIVASEQSTSTRIGGPIAGST